VLRTAVEVSFSRKKERSGLQSAIAYSITSSAWASTVAGISRPSAFAAANRLDPASAACSAAGLLKFSAAKGEVMIRTPVCDLFQIDYPIALGGMGSVYAPELVAAVSGAGGLGAMGCHYLTPEQVHAGTAAIRELTNRPFALNFLLFDIEEDSFASALALRPSVIAFAWPTPEQDVKRYVDRAHAAGCKVTFMAGGVPEARKAAQAGADVIIAQGTEGGGHVGWQTTMTLMPMVVDAVAPIPVLAAGGIADGRGLAAAIMLGADGVLLGTRFLASRESSLHPNFKQAILESDGHDTLLSEIPDIAAGLVWPGAMSRSRRNRFIERWAGREWVLRQRRAEAKTALQTARKSGDVDEAVLSMGQDAGLIHDIAPAAEIVSRIAEEAERILTDRAMRFIKK
jgi:NAD(P)H-dependent flavin oxidoreductase YrpB (nitropropane dioxygenase family)